MHRKTPVLETLFTLEKGEIFQSTYFEEHLSKADSENIYETKKKSKIVDKGF